MEYYGIDKTLACHSIACGYNPSEGNNILMEIISKYPQIQGTWVLLPHHTGEFPNPVELQKLLKSNNVRSVTLMPKEHIFSLSEYVCGDLLSMLEECRVPLFLSSEQVGYGDLYSILTTHPGLRIVLTNLHYNCARNLYPLLEKFEHLYIETSGFKVFGGIEDVCQRFGAQRLIFGTCAPVYAGSAAIGMITYADISQREKQMIASENLENLLGGVRL
jgi:predicted TIM-barrel fold metal-dependent hydrolase